MLANPHTPGFLVDARKVATLADTIFARARAAGLAQPRVGTDHITDCLDGQVLRVICYERKHVWEPFDMTLPISIAEASEADIMERLARSDFVFLSDAATSASIPTTDKCAHCTHVCAPGATNICDWSTGSSFSVEA